MATPRLALTEITASDASKFARHNEALYQIEAQTTYVISRTNGGPPASPVHGQVFIVDVATGAWSGQLNMLAQYRNGAWYFFNPALTRPIVWLQSEQIAIVHNGTAWQGVPSSIVAGAGLAFSPAGTMNVGAGQGMQVNADDIEIKLDGATLKKSLAGLALADLASGSVLIGNGSNVATAQAISGDVTLSNTGVATVSAAAAALGAYVKKDGTVPMTGPWIHSLSPAVDGPNVDYVNGTKPCYVNFGKSGQVAKISVGALGNDEGNISYNMDYATGIHRLFDQSKNAIWIFMGPDWSGMQYAPATSASGDVWNLSGNLINYASFNASGNFYIRGRLLLTKGAGISETGTSIGRRAGTAEANVTAPPGSLNLDETNRRAEIKDSGTGNTGWMLLAKAKPPESFTPTVVGATTAGAATYGARVARVTYIMDLCFLLIAVSWTGHTGTGALKITGLTYPSANLGFNIASFNISAEGIMYMFGYPTAYIAVNSSEIVVRVQGSGSSFGNIDVPMAGTLYLSGFYKVAQL